MEQRGQGDFWTGLVAGAVIGGLVGAGVGVALAPRLRRKRSLASVTSAAEPQLLPADADQSISRVRRTLEQKIAELNEAIRDTRAQLLVEDPTLLVARSSQPPDDAAGGPAS